MRAWRSWVSRCFRSSKALNSRFAVFIGLGPLILERSKLGVQVFFLCPERWRQGDLGGLPCRRGHRFEEHPGLGRFREIPGIRGHALAIGGKGRINPFPVQGALGEGGDEGPVGTNTATLGTDTKKGEPVRHPLPHLFCQGDRLGEG